MTETDFAITTADIIEATGGTLLRTGRTDLCRALSIDSRDLPRESLYIPVKGNTWDGHDFLSQAIASGAAAVLLAEDHAHRISKLSGQTAVISVGDTVRALGDIAHWWRNRFPGLLAAVTGSSGKTTTKEMIAHTAEKSFNIIKNRGNLNNCIGLPLSLLRLRSHHEAGIFELASNRPGEIARLAEIARPDVAVITNVGPAHLQGFETLEAVREEKGSLFSALKEEGLAVINRDDPNIRILEDRWRGKSISYGIIEGATVRAEHIFTRGDRGVSFTLKIGGLSRGIDMSVLGTHNIYNALAAAASCHAMAVPFDEICDGLAAFRQVPGRMTVTKLASGATLIDDTYNANPVSVAAALKTLAAVREKGRGVFILGDMLELGNHGVLKHEEAGALAAATGVDMLFLTGDFAGAVAKGAREAGMDGQQIHEVNGPEDVLPVLFRIQRSDVWILVKGSRGMKMERFVEAIKAAGTGEATS